MCSYKVAMLDYDTEFEKKGGTCTKKVERPRKAASKKKVGRPQRAHTPVVAIGTPTQRAVDHGVRHEGRYESAPRGSFRYALSEAARARIGVAPWSLV